MAEQWNILCGPPPMSYKIYAIIKDQLSKIPRRNPLDDLKMALLIIDSCIGVGIRRIYLLVEGK
jgi:hypothetical protein